MTIYKEKYLKNPFQLLSKLINTSKMSKIDLERGRGASKMEGNDEIIQTLPVCKHAFLHYNIVEFGIVGKVGIGTVRLRYFRFCLDITGSVITT